MNRRVIENIHARVAEIDDASEILEIHISEDFDVAHADELHILWMYFRSSHPIAIQKYDRPVDNYGRTRPRPKLDERLSIMYSMAEEWFEHYISLDDCGPTSTVLKIAAPRGGIYIRKVLPSENLVHKFVTAVLPADELSSLCVISYERALL